MVLRKGLKISFSVILLSLTQIGCDVSQVESAISSLTSEASAAAVAESTSSESSAQKPVELKDCSLQTEMSITVSSDLTGDLSEKKLTASESIINSNCESIAVGDIKSVRIDKLVKKDDSIEIYRGPRAEVFTLLADRSLQSENVEFCRRKNKLSIVFESGSVDLDTNSIKIIKTITAVSDESCEEEKSKVDMPGQHRNHELRNKPDSGN